jgi:hypothetical protein
MRTDIRDSSSRHGSWVAAGFEDARAEFERLGFAYVMNNVDHDMAAARARRPCATRSIAPSHDEPRAEA